MSSSNSSARFLIEMKLASMHADAQALLQEKHS